MFRGKLSSQQIDNTMVTIRNKQSNFFVEWIPHNIKTSLCDVAPKDTPAAVTFIANSTSLRHLFTRVQEQFALMFRRKAFVHSYLEEGMDLMEFSEAESNLLDLVTEYQQYEQVGLDDDDVDKDNTDLVDEETQ